MGLRGWIKRLERNAREEMVEIPQTDGTVKRFPQSDMKAAFLEGLDRELGRARPGLPEHPMLEAARNSSEAKWRESIYAVQTRTEPVPDLSE